MQKTIRRTKTKNETLEKASDIVGETLKHYNTVIDERDVKITILKKALEMRDKLAAAREELEKLKQQKQQKQQKKKQSSPKRRRSNKKKRRTRKVTKKRRIRKVTK